MTEHEIIKGLIARDNCITKIFFFIKCRPLFYSVMRTVFDYEVEYDEMVNEFYVYLMEDDAAKLRNFGHRCSIYMWLKVLAIRFFLKKRARMIDNRGKETPYEEQGPVGGFLSDTTAEHDVERLLEVMPTKRYAHVIRRLILEDCEPEVLAHEMNITTANLYNIKRRAMAQLIRVAFNDIKEYGK